MKHYILGTAGHVDHGKTTLIKALTSVDTDRLPEEKARGLSIDLGFAPLGLEGADGPIQLGVVDVPGHHRFLRNMIAGVGGFDACLLVVDCLEGVKPQTSEHLKILQLLDTRAGVVALTKVDKSEPDGVEIARWELEELLRGTFLEGAPIVAVSATDHTGLDQLRAALYDTFRLMSSRSSSGVVRLPIDRVFKKAGFGDVVTGSLWSGRLRVGDEVQIMPAGGQAKVRGLQVHGKAVSEAWPGQRVAVNLSGSELEGLHRGQALVGPPDALSVGQRYSVEAELVEPLAKLSRRKFPATFYQATAHYPCQVNLVAEDEDATEVYGQLLFEQPVLLCRGDRFLLRDAADQILLAGGSVLGLDEVVFKRSRAATLMQRYKALAGTGEAGRLVSSLKEKGGYAKESALKKQLGLSAQDWESQIALLLEAEKLIRVGKDKLWLTEDLETQSARLAELLTKLAQAAPWKPGWKVSELHSLLGLKTGREHGLDDVLDWMESQARVSRRGPLYAPAGHRPTLDAEAAAAAERIVSRLRTEGFAPTDWPDLLEEESRNQKKMAAQLEDYLFGTEAVLRMADKMVTTPEVLDRARAVLIEHDQEGFTASEARQILDTSRKYAIPLLEWMDRQGWTVRAGDRRRMTPPK